MAERENDKTLISRLTARFRKGLTKRQVRLLIYSALHAVWLIFWTLIDLWQPFTTDEEMIMLKSTSYIKNVLIKGNERPDPNRFLFVCLSWDKALIEKNDSEGFPIGTQTVTDREKVAKLLNVLNQKPDNHKFLLLDMRFEDTTPMDSALIVEFKRTKNYLVSYHKTRGSKGQDSLTLPVLPAKAGLSDYETTENGTIVKFGVIQADTAKTTPLLMYEKIYNKTYKEGFFWDVLDGKPMLNNFILDYRLYLTSDSLAKNSTYSHTYLGELLSLPPEEIHKLTKDRIIIAGDFEDLDIHETIYGDMPGSIILLNAFLALENEDNRLYFGFLLFLFAGYTVLSYRCFSQHNFFEKIMLGWLPVHEEIKKLLEEFAGYVVIMIIMSVISYFIFNIHLTILLIAIYLQLVDWIISFIRKRREEKKWKEATLVTKKEED